MQKLRILTRSALRTLPDEGRLIKRWARNAIMYKELVISKSAQYVTGASLPNPRTVFQIDPRRIEYATCFDNGSGDWEDWVLPQYGSRKLILSGDWDLLRHRVADMRIVAAMRARIHSSASWSSTEYYQTAVRQIESGRVLWGCSDRAAFDRRCTRIDELIASVRYNGYRIGGVGQEDIRVVTATGQSEILINISREGLPLFQDGRHRLAIALALDLPSIPVQVLVRHAEWQSFREFLWRMARSSRGASKAGVLYQRAAHFDLADIPAEHGCEERWEVIARHLPTARGGHALDIGCNLGFMCHRLEERGFVTVGVELLPDIAFSAQRIAKAEGRRFEVLGGDVLDEAILAGVGSHFDVVIALNIFHHFIKSETGYHRLRALLERLSIETMYFEPHRPDERQMQTAYANPSPEEFVKLVCDWARFKTAEPIFHAGDGRVVFRLSR